MRLHKFSLPIRSEDDLRDFVWLAWGVEIPDVVICKGKGHTSPWRAFCDAYFARAPITVWHAARGFGGKSYLLALLGLTEAVTLGADVNILAGSGEQSQRVLEYNGDFWAHKGAPKGLLASDPAKRETTLKTGNYIKALTASSRSVRGPHPQRLRLDEVDEIDRVIFDASLGQPMTKRGVSPQTVCSSTHHYPDKTMTHVLDRAASDGWPIYKWCYKETMEPHGWLSKRDVDQKRLVVPKAMWEVEYDLAEPRSETLAIDPGSVKRMFKNGLGEFDGYLGEYIEIEGPQPGAEYSTGADWAKARDYTVIVTWRIDITPARLVAFRRAGRLPWPVMIGYFNDQVNRYPGEAYHDETGLGSVVGDHLTVSAIGVTLAGKVRYDMLSNYIAAIERNEVEAPMINWVYLEHLRASREAVYGSEKHLPDSICAMALANLYSEYRVEVGRVSENA